MHQLFSRRHLSLHDNDDSSLPGGDACTATHVWARYEDVETAPRRITPEGPPATYLDKQLTLAPSWMAASKG
jgi:hypothetical protein